jgi:DNA-binding transcriptional MerR regulator
MDDGRIEGGRMKRMERLLRKKDLVEKTGIAKSTISDWIVEFNVYIPKVRHGNVVYYKPEAIDVLNAIKEFRAKDYSKVQIMELLANRGFPVTVEEAIDDMQKLISEVDPRDRLLTIMQTLGQAISGIAEQNKEIETLKIRQDGQDGRIDKQDERIHELERLLIESRNEIIEMKKALEKANRPFWKKLFNIK